MKIIRKKKCETDRGQRWLKDRDMELERNSESKNIDTERYTKKPGP